VECVGILHCVQDDGKDTDNGNGKDKDNGNGNGRDNGNGNGNGKDRDNGNGKRRSPSGMTTECKSNRYGKSAQG
jgi:hypothetical protein